MYGILVPLQAATTNTDKVKDICSSDIRGFIEVTIYSQKRYY